MTDAKLQSTFKTLPARCVILVEDIDAAGIGREDLVQAEKKSKEKEKARKAPVQDEWGNPSEETFESNPEAHCRENNIEVAPEHSFITLSGLLNTLDGPEAKEGRFVVLTTNSPRTLDDALTRKRRMDKVIYMGYSCPAFAAGTFKRMFGTDLTFRVPEAELERLAERFAKKIPKDMFTPCAIVDHCREHRGRPREAIKNFRKFVEDRIEGKDEYLYDIKDEDGKAQDEDAEDNEAKIQRQLAALPPDEPYPESEREGDAYCSLEETPKSPSSDTESAPSTPLKVAGSLDRSSFSTEENFAP